MENNRHQTYQRIMDVAREEFLTKGYEKASLRTIAGKIGISATAIYRHFTDKEALFSALVEPDLNEMFRTHARHDDELFNYIRQKQNVKIWHLSELEFIESLNYVYDHYSSFKLLLCCAEGTRLHNFQHELVADQVEALLEMHKIAKESGIAVKQISSSELHLIMSGFFSSIFEMVIHDYSREDALKCGHTLIRFFNTGISDVLGI